ncbi:MAG: GNAT family N-acetyltransferase [Duncaniella sp.]|nr:GNAT family N-acetyltransferase [Duncaniella sp.]MDE6571799.1 GNAT family N-acetyltransferase [Duncaniella sp.]
MSKRDDIMKIWRESFSDSKEYVTMYFDSVYRDEDALTLTDPSGQTVSSLLLQRYEMKFQQTLHPVGYIAGAATVRRQRGKGYMSALMADTLHKSAARGDMLCTLIPARSALYFYYRRFGFSTIFYTKEQRFTSLHSFPVRGVYESLDDPVSEDIWQAFDRFQNLRPCYIQHSRRDFENILADLRMDGGDFVAITSDDEDHGPRIVSMAWAVPRQDLLLVTDVMGESDDARTAALQALRRLHPDTPFLLYGRPGDSMGGRLMPRGMGRVVNVSLLLAAVAAAHPDLRCAIRVNDPILSDLNSHTFVVADGLCKTDDGYKGRLDFDVNIEVFGEIAFSSPAIGDIIRFPAERPMISLMLD